MPSFNDNASNNSPLQRVGEKVQVVFHVLLVEPQAHGLVDPLERRQAVRHHRHRKYGFRHRVFTGGRETFDGHLFERNAAAGRCGSD